MSAEAGARPTVLVTGPVQRIEEYVAAAEEAGWRAAAWPLIEIEPTDVDIVGLIDGLPDLVCVTSGHALDALERTLERLPELRTVPLACVGTKTGGAARRLGFELASEPADDAESLAAALLESFDEHGSSKTFLWPRGSLSHGLGEALAQAGHTVLDPVVYEPRNTEGAPPVPVDSVRAVLLASPSAARALRGRELDWGATAAIAIGRTTAGSLGDHPELFDAILTLERPAPEAFAATLHEIETPADRP